MTRHHGGENAKTTPHRRFIDQVDLSFDLDPAKTCVFQTGCSWCRTRRWRPSPLRLDGEESTWHACWSTAGCSFKMEGSQPVLEKLPEGEPISPRSCHLRRQNSHGPMPWRRQAPSSHSSEAEGFQASYYPTPT